MTTTSFKFQCPNCAQRLECDIDLAGREIDCPGCERPLIIPEPPTIEARPKAESGIASTGAVRPRDRLSHLALGAMLGAFAGSVISLWLNPPWFLRGDELWHSGSNSVLDWIFAISYRTVLSGWGITGGIVGGVWARQRFMKRLAMAVPGVAPESILAAEFNFSAPASFVLATGSMFLTILMWSWLLTRPPEAFHDQGGMAITFAILLTPVLWMIGGPVARALGQRGLDRARPDKARDQWLALTGIFISRLMLWGGIVVPCLALWRVSW